MTAHFAVAPAADEYAPYYGTYVSKVPPGDVVALLARLQQETAAFLAKVPAAKEDFRYAPGKWTVKEVIGHLSDAERVFIHRAFRFGRGDTTPLPSFDENKYVPESEAGQRSLKEMAAEFSAVRQATLELLKGLPAAAWSRRGEASGKSVSVRALAWITAGHEIHHMGVLKERYGLEKS